MEQQPSYVDREAEEREALVQALFIQQHEEDIKLQRKEAPWTGEEWGRVVKFPTLRNRRIDPPFGRKS